MSQQRLGALLDMVKALVGEPETPSLEAAAINKRIAFLIDDQAAWSQATFGTDAERGPIGALRHLVKETYEAAARPTDLTEYADCLILYMDAARRMGCPREAAIASLTQAAMSTKIEPLPANPAQVQLDILRTRCYARIAETHVGRDAERHMLIKACGGIGANIINATMAAGYTMPQLIEAAIAKMAVNKSRQWPKPTTDEPVEHVRDAG